MKRQWFSKTPTYFEFYLWRLTIRWRVNERRWREYHEMPPLDKSFWRRVFDASVYAVPVVSLFALVRHWTGIPQPDWGTVAFMVALAHFFGDQPRPVQVDKSEA